MVAILTTALTPQRSISAYYIEVMVMIFVLNFLIMPLKNVYSSVVLPISGGSIPELVNLINTPRADSETFKLLTVNYLKVCQPVSYTKPCSSAGDVTDKQT